eukprot:sb/3469813/
MLKAEGILHRELTPQTLYKVHNMFQYTRLYKARTLEGVDSARSIVVIRNPWTRMVSGFRDKLGEGSEETNGHTKRYIGVKIVEESRNMLKGQVISDNLYPTFEEFLRYLVRHNGDVNVHFAPQYKTLCLEHGSYDHIIPLEYSAIMFPPVMKTINSTIQLRGSYDAVHDPRLSSSTAKAKAWFQNIDKGLIEDLYRIFKLDFIMANYSNFTDPEFPLPIF